MEKIVATLKPGSKEFFFLIACINTQVLALYEFERNSMVVVATVLHGQDETQRKKLYDGQMLP